MYRSLSSNERIVICRVLSQERGLTEDTANSLLMAYDARAMHVDLPAFQIFQESELERKAANAQKKPSYGNWVDFVKNEIEQSATEKANVHRPANTYERFWGDESLFDATNKRLRVMFFNSARYRLQVLYSYVESGLLLEEDFDNLDTVRQKLHDHYKKYPGTRQGFISDYEIYFGDSSEFSYRLATMRNEFFSNVSARNDYLAHRGLPLDIGMTEIKEHMKKSALSSGMITQDQVARWELLTRR